MLIPKWDNGTTPARLEHYNRKAGDRMGYFGTLLGEGIA